MEDSSEPAKFIASLTTAETLNETNAYFARTLENQLNIAIELRIKM